MAGPILKFRHNTTDLNLLSESSFMLDGARGGYVPGVAPETPGRESPPITESIPTFTQVADDDALAVQEQALNAMVRRAARFIADPLQPYPVWLHSQMKNETGERRALVRSITYSPVRSRFDGAVSGGGIHAEHNLVIERAPWWEATAETTSSINGTSMDVLVDALSLGTVGGDVPARLYSLLFNIPAASTWGNFWLGFRSANKHGTLANFEPVWECEDGSNETDASDAADAYASGGNRVTISFATNDAMAQRVILELGDVTANPSDNLGRFMVLLRATMSSGTANIYVTGGVSGANQYDLVVGPEVTVSGTHPNYYIYEMGIFTLPLLDRQRSAALSASDELDLQSLSIYAERASGAGSLYLDCLILIPIDEYYIRVLNDGNAGNVTMGTNPQGEMSKTTVRTTTSNLYRIEPPPVEGVGIPVGDVVLIGKASTTSGLDDLSSTVTATLKYYKRYRSLRGAG